MSRGKGPSKQNPGRGVIALAGRSLTSSDWCVLTLIGGSLQGFGVGPSSGASNELVP